MNYNDLDLNLIKVFLSVYESKSILLASKKLYISQPAITKSIQKLENYLGGKLFIRTAKGTVPTKEGEEFNASCYNAMQILNSGINKFAALSNLEQGVLNIGSSSTIIRKLLLPFIEQFNKKYPKIVITITDTNSEKLTKYVKTGVIDLAILNSPIDNIDIFKVTTLTQTNDCFIAHPDFPHNHLSKEQLANQKIIVQKRPSSNRDYFDKMCNENKINFRPSFEIGSFGLITDFVSKNLGIAYTIKEFIKEDIKANRVKIIETDFISRPRDIVAITLQTSINSFVCNKFISELKSYFENQN